MASAIGGFPLRECGIFSLMSGPVGSLDSVALYRKYRPGSFGELLGQEQVTVPLSNALDSGRINHAYLFSGPRGCGKTSSARILARSLNCEQGPTSTPCGQCPSCIALAPNGPGTLDVTELDAASHNGVDDMRELRDRAMYAPADSRYRIFIIDEAHMITNQGANALLKVVEEPPAHLIFIFATTEPEKVIPTIRSRVHHYPFRLLTPQSMRTLVERTVASEGIPVEDAVYPLVIRAGGGSPRDTLSVLDQLLAGAGPEGLTYETARMLLGATDDVLIDAAVDALGTGNAASLFQTVDDIIESGLDPRRFAQDLLDRLRDLMVLQAVPDAFESGLVDAPTDRADILRGQSQVFAPSELPRLSAMINDGLSGLKGATSPRLLLEILCAKMLLPVAAPVAAAQQSAPVARPQVSGTAQASAAATAGAQADSSIQPKYERKSVRLAREKAEREAREAREAQERLAKEQVAEENKPQQPQEQEADKPQEVAASQAPAEQDHKDAPSQPQPAEEPTPVEEAETPAAAEEPEAKPEPQDESDENFAARVRSNWSKVRSLVSKDNMVAGIMLAEAKVLGFKDSTVVLGHNTGALAERLNAAGNNDAIVKSIAAELGRDVKVHCVIGTNSSAAGFEAPKKTPQWNPNAEQEAKDAAESEPEEHERPADNTGSESSHAESSVAPSASSGAEQEEETPFTPAQENATQQDLQEQAAEESFDGAPPARDPQEAEDNAETAEGTGATQGTEDSPRGVAAQEAQPAAQSEDDIWGAPAPVGQDLPKPKPLRTEPPTQQSDDVWGEPAKVGQGSGEEQSSPTNQAEDDLDETPVTPEPAPAPQPVTNTAEEKPSRRANWQARAARGEEILKERAKHEFSDGSPLPPEPDDWDAPPPEPDYGYPEDNSAPTAPPAPAVKPEPQASAAQRPSYAREPQRKSRFERARAAAESAGPADSANDPAPEPVYDQSAEEEEMIEAAAMEPGNRDRRDAMTVAMDMLAEELGAKKV